MKTKSRLELKTSKNNKTFIHVKAKNNKVIMAGEEYNSPAAVKKAIKVIKQAVKNPVVDKTKKKKK